MAKFIRKKGEPLPAWEDKLNAAIDFIRRDDIVCKDTDYEYDIIMWHVTINMFGEIMPKMYTAIKATPRTKVGFPKELRHSPYGMFCAHCRTNEYLRSNNDHVPVSKRSNDAGFYCVACGAS